MDLTAVDQVAAAFAKHYYDTFKNNRPGLAGLYQNESIMTWESNRHIGQAAIVQHLVNLPFQKVEHRIGTIDAQPSTSNGVLVFITGQILPDAETNPLKFSQIFHLVQVGGSYVVSNDMFRLNYA